MEIAHTRKDRQWIDVAAKGECAMDLNRMTPGGAPTSGIPMGLPLGFGMGLAMNESAMKGYAELTETEREHIINRCKDARSKDEMQKIIDSLVPDGNVNNLYEHNDTAEG